MLWFVSQNTFNCGKTKYKGEIIIMSILNNKQQNQIIPVFFSSDDNYIPYLAVSIRSLIDTTPLKQKVCVYVLNEHLKIENMFALKKMETRNIKIKFVNVSNKIKAIRDKLVAQLRDYYSPSIYYRIFIASLFPKLDKAIYLDCDIAIVDNIAKMYNKDLGNNLVGAVVDEIVNSNIQFKTYVQEAVGIDADKYFNSGILLMNLKEFREQSIEEQFIYYLNNYPFSSLCPDQDYLNFLCKNKVLYMEKGWDKMTVEDSEFDEKDLYLVHYNMFKKPWKYYDVMFDKYFWQAARKTEFYTLLLKQRDSYTEEQRQKDYQAAANMISYSSKVVADSNNFKKSIEKNPPKVSDILKTTSDKTFKVKAKGTATV